MSMPLYPAARAIAARHVAHSRAVSCDNNNNNGGGGVGKMMGKMGGWGG